MSKRLAITLFVLASASGAFATHRLPTIGLSQTSVTIDAPAGGPNPAPSTVALSNPGTGKLTWTASVPPAAPWLSVSPTGGELNHNASIDLSISVDVAGLAVGTYNSAVTITAAGASNSPQQIAITLRVNSSARIALSPATLSFAAPEGGSNPPSQNVTIQNTGGSTLNWTATFSQTWLSASPASGSLNPGASSTFAVSVDIYSLAAGTYPGTITVTAPNALNSPQTVGVTLTVSQLPRIGLSPSTLTFDAPQGGANPPSKPATLSNQGGQSMPWTAATNAAWLSVSPTSGTLGSGLNQTLTVSVNTAGLTEGTYLADVTVTAPAATNTPQSVTVTLNINALPKIGLNPKTFTFSVSVDSPVSPAAGLSITNTGSGTLNWTVSGGAGWIGLQPGSGTLTALASQAALLTANGAGLAPGLYTTTLQIEDPLASNSPQTVSVELTVRESSLPIHAPAGQCGLSGLEGLIPVLLVLARRRFPKRGERA